MPVTSPFPAPRLDAEALSKRYGRRVLFERLGFVLAAGDVLAVTGPNGAGKSTLLQVLAGLLPATAGSVHLTLGGQPVAAEERPLRVGFVAPYLNVYDELSAEENLAFLAHARRLPHGAARIAGILDRVGLGRRGRDLVRTYSSGMRQRVRFASALLADPAVLFLDEPGSNLDAEGRALVERVIQEQRAAGGIVVLATNAEAEAALCDREVRIVPPSRRLTPPPYAA